MFLVDVTDVRPLAGRRLSLTFSDGRSGVVELGAIVGEYSGVFAPFSEQIYFNEVRVEPELGTVVWPNGADLCPDVLYAHATGQVDRLNSLAV